MNVALLSKLLWKIVIGKGSFWCNIMKAKFLKGNSLFSCQWNDNCSFVLEKYLKCSKHDYGKFLLARERQLSSFDEDLRIRLRDSLHVLARSITFVGANQIKEVNYELTLDL